MKISKLFHWLYAFLMFLPVLALAPSLFYFAFNQQSQNYTDVQVIETYEYETNEVNSVDDLVVGNIYHLSFDNALHQNIPFRLYYSDVYNFEYTAINGLARYTISEYGFLSYGNNTGSLGILKSGSDCYAITLYADYQIELDFIFSSYNSDFVNNNAIQFVSASTYLGEKNVEVVRSEQSPMNIFYTAVNYVYDMPVFSWAKNSFLALPITYITGLFGMASTNVVNYYLSYWLAISIVYLVFDLVMYVPLLVHRWIDKGMIE